MPGGIIDGDFMIEVHHYFMCMAFMPVNGRKPLKDQGIRVAARGLRACFCYC